MTPWFDLAKAELGTKEAPGDADNSVVLDYYADAGHPEIAHDSVAWCSAFVGSMLVRAGYPSTSSLAARSYLQYGVRLERPTEGCIVVMKRGNSSWEGHVGFYMGDAGSSIRVLGGNQGDAVSIATFPKSSVLGYRMPIAPTVSALRQAGSTEIATADNIQKAAVGTGGAVAVAEAAERVLPAAPAANVLTDTAEQVTLVQRLAEGMRAVLDLLMANRSAVIIVLCVAAVGVGWWLKKRRAKRARAGVPLSNQTAG